MGRCPNDRMTTPNSAMLILPSSSLSKSMKASLNSVRVGRVYVYVLMWFTQYLKKKRILAVYHQCWIKTCICFQLDSQWFSVYSRKKCWFAFKFGHSINCCFPYNFKRSCFQIMKKLGIHITPLKVTSIFWNFDTLNLNGKRLNKKG